MLGKRAFLKFVSKELCVRDTAGQELPLSHVCAALPSSAPFPLPSSLSRPQGGWDSWALLCRTRDVHPGYMHLVQCSSRLSERPSIFQSLTQITRKLVLYFLDNMSLTKIFGS